MDASSSTSSSFNFNASLLLLGANLTTPTTELPGNGTTEALATVVDEGPFPMIRKIVIAIQAPAFILTAAFGSVTNAISMVVFYRQGILADSCTTSLAAMALQDFLATTHLMLSMAVGLRHTFGLISWEEDRYLIMHTNAIRWVVTLPVRVWLEMSMWTTVYLTVDRMVCVVWPFKAKSIFTPKRSLMIIGGVSLYSVLISLHILLGTKWVWTSFLNGTVTIIQAVSTGWVSEENFEYVVMVRDVAMRFIRVATVIVCNAMILHTIKGSKKFKETSANQTTTTTTAVVKKASNKMKNKTNGDETAANNSTNNEIASNQPAKQDQKEVKLMRMVLVLSWLYVICYFPGVVKEVLYYIDYFVWDFGYWYYPYWGLDLVTDFLEFGNTSSNFIIYCAMSSRYRAELKQMCGCRRRKQK